MNRNTKLLIADTFIEKVANTSLSRIRIADLINTIGINRNTFYYYFSNKYDVAMWVFRKDLANELRASFPECELTGSQIEGKEEDPIVYPYYVHVETGARTLDYSGFLKALVRCTHTRREFYRKLFTTQEPEFTACLFNLFYPVTQNDLDFILGARYMPLPTRRMLCTMCVHHIIFIAGFCLDSPEGESMLDDKINPFWNFMQESLYSAIQNHPINRHKN